MLLEGERECHPNLKLCHLTIKFKPPRLEALTHCFWHLKSGTENCYLGRMPRQHPLRASYSRARNTALRAAPQPQRLGQRPAQRRSSQLSSHSLQVTGAAALPWLPQLPRWLRQRLCNPYGGDSEPAAVNCITGPAAAAAVAVDNSTVIRTWQGKRRTPWPSPC